MKSKIETYAVLKPGSEVWVRGHVKEAKISEDGVFYDICILRRLYDDFCISGVSFSDISQSATDNCSYSEYDEELRRRV